MPFRAYVPMLERVAWTVVSANVSKFPVKVSLRCSSCGAPGSGSCQCGTGYVPAGEYAVKAAQQHPELSSRELAKQTGVSQRTAVRALRTAREPFGSPVLVVRGRDGKSYPAMQPERPEPAQFYGDNDFRYAKSHINQAMMAFKRNLPPEDWKELVEWLSAKLLRWRGVH